MGEYIRANKKYQKKFAELTEFSATVSDSEIFVHLENDINVNDEEILKRKEFVLRVLSQKDRELYEKIYIEKKTYKEIAKKLNIPLKTVSSRAFKLRKKITKRVDFTFTVIGQIIIKYMF
jgi:RNA polymerase sigma factor (sigma-70 family)